MTELRDMRESDIADYVRWFTTETEWGNWVSGKSAGPGITGKGTDRDLMRLRFDWM